MNSEITNLSKSKILFLILFLFTCIFILFCTIISGEYKVKVPEVERIEYSGRYTLNQSNESFIIPENKNIQLQNKKISKITFILNFNNDISKDEQINLYLDKVKLNVYKNGDIIHTYGNDNQPDIVKSIGTEWTSFISPGINADDTIAIELESYYGEISEVYINKFLVNIFNGTDYNLLRYQLQQNSLQILFSVLIFITGFVLFVVLLTFKIMKSPIHMGDIFCGLLMMSGALFLLINHDYITLLFKNAFIVNIFEFLNKLFIVYFLLMYSRIYIYNKKIKSTINFFTSIWSVIILTFFVFQVTGVVDFIQFSEYIIIPAGLLILFSSFFLIMEFNKNKNANKKTVLISSIILSLSILAEIIIKATTDKYSSEIFMFTLLTFTITQFISIMIISKRNTIKAAKTEKMESELLQSKISVMLSQIQPHFLYNTLVVIRQLCDIDPKMAKEAITEFASYLRGNLDSLTLNNTISFEKEMEHVENYISLEKKRFGDKINIDYDIEAVEFEVPSLTIQTIVENAIRHGITKRKEGGTVTIRTRENHHNYTIEVHDNGVGVDLTKPPQQDNNRSHIGVENTKKRIETMCDGELIFESTPNIGTSVFITLPKKSNDEEIT
ncbi:MAG: histidine kinase [Acutalibacteraceae bacterium]|nr:histidine kinase [Acutalibacteraceae bacterium]